MRIGETRVDRKDDLEQYIEEYRIQRLKSKRGRIGDIKQKLRSVFCEKLNLLIEDQQLTKREGPGKIEVFYLCRLLSSGYTESYESIIGLSNALVFLDKNKSQTFWYPKHIYNSIENDMNEVEKRLKKKYLHIEEYELLHIKQLLLLDDWEVLEDCFVGLVQEHLKILTNSYLDFESELKVMSGNYMEQLKQKNTFSANEPNVEDHFINSLDQAKGDIYE